MALRAKFLVRGTMDGMRRLAGVVLWLALSLAALGGWLLLVLLAIDAGTDALDGDSGRRWVSFGAIAGAIVLMVLAVAFVRRLLVALGVIRAYEPRRARR